jgi:hypothetical protein
VAAEKRVAEERERKQVAAHKMMEDAYRRLHGAVRQPAASPATVSVPEQQKRKKDDKDDEEHVGNAHECVVCLSNAPTHVALSCGHLCACADCSTTLAACPVCRAPTERWQRVYIV